MVTNLRIQQAEDIKTEFGASGALSSILHTTTELSLMVYFHYCFNIYAYYLSYRKVDQFQCKDKAFFICSIVTTNELNIYNILYILLK